MFCKNCGTELDNTAAFCPKCGTPVNSTAQTPPQGTPAAEQPEQKSQLVAGLLGILLGGLGIHNFYLGFTGKAVAQLILTICSCGLGAIWGFIEGILILVGNINKDARGIPLKKDL
ncbi:MAG: NINE protein [Clostridia bacterium]|nr:NINE protein [Clostridia bacterium]